MLSSCKRPWSRSCEGCAPHSPTAPPSPGPTPPLRHLGREPGDPPPPHRKREQVLGGQRHRAAAVRGAAHAPAGDMAGANHARSLPPLYTQSHPQPIPHAGAPPCSTPLWSTCGGANSCELVARPRRRLLGLVCKPLAVSTLNPIHSISLYRGSSLIVTRAHVSGFAEGLSNVE